MGPAPRRDRREEGQRGKRDRKGNGMGGRDRKKEGVGGRRDRREGQEGEKRIFIKVHILPSSGP